MAFSQVRPGRSAGGFAQVRPPKPRPASGGFAQVRPRNPAAGFTQVRPKPTVAASGYRQVEPTALSRLQQLAAAIRKSGGLTSNGLIARAQAPAAHRRDVVLSGQPVDFSQGSLAYNGPDMNIPSFAPDYTPTMGGPGPIDAPWEHQNDPFGNPYGADMWGGFDAGSRPKPASPLPTWTPPNDIGHFIANEKLLTAGSGSSNMDSLRAKFLRSLLRGGGRGRFLGY
jgi:hypothetical protein